MPFMGKNFETPNMSLIIADEMWMHIYMSNILAEKQFSMPNCLLNIKGNKPCFHARKIMQITL